MRTSRDSSSTTAFRSTARSRSNTSIRRGRSMPSIGSARSPLPGFRFARRIRTLSRPPSSESARMIEFAYGQPVSESASDRARTAGTGVRDAVGDADMAGGRCRHADRSGGIRDLHRRHRGADRSLRAADTRGRTFNGQGRGGRIADQDEWMETSFQHSTELLDVATAALHLGRLAATSSGGFRDDEPQGPDPGEHPRARRTHRRDPGCGDFGPADPALTSSRSGTCSTRRDAPPCVRGSSGTRRVAACSCVGIRSGDGTRLVLRAHQPGMSALGRSTLQRLLDDPGIPRGSGSTGS